MVICRIEFENKNIMQSILLKISEIDLKDRLTVEHYICQDIKLIHKLRESVYPLVPLGQIAKVKGGKRLPANAQYSITGIPYVRVVDIGDFEVDLSNVVYISEDLHNKIQRYQLQQNDIAIVIVGATIGKTAIFKSTVSPCNFNENLARISSKDNKFNLQYLLAYLQSCFGQAYISWLTGGSAQAKLSLERIEKINIPIPPKPIQDRIAQIIENAYVTKNDNLIRANQLLKGIDIYILENLGIKLDTVIYKNHFLVPASKFLGERFDVGYISKEFNPSDYPNISWLHLHEVATFPSSTKIPSRNPNKEYLYIGMTDVDELFGEVNINNLLGKDIKANKLVIKGNDVVFARIEPCIYNRKIALISSDITEALGSTELLIARANPNVLPSFLFWLLRSELIQRQIAGKMTGTTGRRRLPDEVFGSLKLPKISLELQKLIVDEATRRKDEAKRLYIESEDLIIQAKARVERIILGEEEVT